MAHPQAKSDPVENEEKEEIQRSVFLSELFLRISTDCSHSFQCCRIGIGLKCLEIETSSDRRETGKFFVWISPLKDNL